MQIGKGQVPLRLYEGPLNRGVRRTPAQKLSRALATANSPATIKRQADAATQAVRKNADKESRATLYDGLTRQLGSLQAAFASLAPAANKPATIEASATGAGRLSNDAVRTLQGVGETLDAVISTLDTLTGPEGRYQDDPFLQDLRDALRSLTGSGDGTSIQGLGDLGFQAENGELRFDPSQLAKVATQDLQKANSFLGTFIGERVSPVLRASVRAIEDEQANAPLEQRLAAKAVSVHGEIARLQQRQQELLYQEVNFQRQQDALKQQAESLRESQRKLDAPEAKKPGAPEKEEFPPDYLDPKTREELAPAPTPAAPAAGPAAPVAPGITSFGLSS